MSVPFAFFNTEKSQPVPDLSELVLPKDHQFAVSITCRDYRIAQIGKWCSRRQSMILAADHDEMAEIVTQFTTLIDKAMLESYYRRVFQCGDSDNWEILDIVYSTESYVSLPDISLSTWLQQYSIAIHTLPRFSKESAQACFDFAVDKANDGNLTKRRTCVMEATPQSHRLFLPYEERR